MRWSGSGDPGGFSSCVTTSCASPARSSAASWAAPVEPQAAAGAGQVPGIARPGPATAVGEAGCLTDGEFDFRLTVAGLADWEGKHIVVSAFENDLAHAMDARRPVAETGIVHYGAYAVICPKA